MFQMMGGKKTGNSQTSPWAPQPPFSVNGYYPTWDAATHPTSYPTLTPPTYPLSFAPAPLSTFLPTARSRSKKTNRPNSVFRTEFSSPSLSYSSLKPDPHMPESDPQPSSTTTVGSSSSAISTNSNRKPDANKFLKK